MRKERFKTLISLALFAFCFFVFLPSLASGATTTESGTVNVDVTIPTFSVGGGDPPPPDNPPSISNLSTTSTQTTATISWSATDDIGVLNVSFEYGPTASYGFSAPVVGSYSASLSSLSPSTEYFFRIIVRDTAIQPTEATGSFFTLATPDTTSPIISSIMVTPGINGVSISWSANESSDGQINYGLNGTYGSTVIDPTFSTSHTINISNLLQNTLYHFRIIATDAAGNASSTLDATFSTLPDATPPPDVGNLSVTGAAVPTLSWTNPFIADFAGITLLKKIGSRSTNRTDGTILYSGTNQTFTDNNVSNDVDYFYTIFSFDTSNNYSGGAFVSWNKPSPPAEICTNGTDDDGDGNSDCDDSDCSAALICQPPEPVPEICGNGIDDDGNGLTDCSDAACVLSLGCLINPPDDGGDGGDGEDGGESGDGGTGGGQTGGSGTGDAGSGDGASGVGGTVTATTTITPPAQTVPEYIRSALSDFEFYTGSRKIALFPVNGEFTVLAGADFTILVREEKLPSSPESIIVVVDGKEKHQLRKNENTFSSQITLPPPGSHPSFIEIDYGNGQVDVLQLVLRTQPLGEILSGRDPVEGAVLTLHDESGVVYPTIDLGVQNPITSATGKYGWVVPNGRYYLVVTKEGYRERRTPVFQVRNNLINLPLSLIRLPPPLTLSVESITEQTKVIAQIGLEKISDTAAVVQDLRNNEVVQETASEVVAPASVSAMTVSTVVLVPWDKLISFLQLIFFQPVLLINKKKRQGWGQVYNAFNKLPIDLATVRLISKDTGKMVQSKVTDSKGKYAFFAPPGKYIIQVVKNNFVFPTAVLKNAKSDGIMADIYHGEEIDITNENAVITANIPLDPIGETKKPVRLYWEQFGRRLQVVLSWTGFAVTLVSLYLSPQWYVWVLLFVHLGMVYVFYRLALPPKVKSWGIVYDVQTKYPVGRVITRLFNLQFNKLVATQITDNRGRYYFLAGDNDYFITYEHPDYQTIKTNKIDLKGHEAENINIDMGLKKS